MKNILVLFGGPSVEHEVSIITAFQALKHIDPSGYKVWPVYWTKDGTFLNPSNVVSPQLMLANLKNSNRVIFDNKTMAIESSGVLGRRLKQIKIDAALPFFHGTGGEDGGIQGLLTSLDIPYAGSGISASAIGMDKSLFKAVMRQHGIATLDYLVVAQKQSEKVEKLVKFSYPVIAKPAHLGSSIGVTKCKDLKELKDAFDVIFAIDSDALIEPYLSKMIEINCSVLGNTDHSEASVCEQPLSSEEILSFADKYMRGGKGKKGPAKGMAGLDRRIPAPIDKHQTEHIQKEAVKIYEACGCSGVARVDFMIDSKTKEIFVTEINTLPGSLAFYLWEASGTSFKHLLDILIDNAEYEYKKQKALLRSFESTLLK